MISTPSFPVIAYLGLGSNLGPRRGNLVTALDRLHAVPGIEVTAVSPRYETAPVGGPPGQQDYLNAAIRIETTLSPEALLATTQRIEDEMGRQRGVLNGPRNIDIDILLYADQISNDPNLTLPHPRVHERSFVLRPLADVAPDVLHPILSRSIAELLATLTDPTPVAPAEDSGWWRPQAATSKLMEHQCSDTRHLMACPEPSRDRQGADAQEPLIQQSTASLRARLGIPVD